MATQFKSNNQDLFQTVSDDLAQRGMQKYVIHRDFPNEGWNIFERTGLVENYVTTFETLEAAQEFCRIQNICTGTDPVRCDDHNCPTHGRV